MTQVFSLPVSPTNTKLLLLHWVGLTLTLAASVIETSALPLLTACLFDCYLGLGRKEMFELSKKAVEFIFADSVVKDDLRGIFNSAAKNLEL